VGDPDKPRFVFFFDEAHLLFDGMPRQLQDKIVQVVKLIRSKGVGVYFITQTPSDIPDEVLAQLSNRVQHGLRAYTPAELKSVKAAAASFRENPAFDSVAALQDVGTGEALVSFLDDEGRPTMVERARVLFPQCRMAAADESVVRKVIEDQYVLQMKYGEAVDRNSAYEMINDAREKEAEEARLEAERIELEKQRIALEKEQAKAEAAAQRKLEQEEARKQRKLEQEEERMRRQRTRVAKSAASEVAGTLLSPYIGKRAGKSIVRGILDIMR
jgi:DNA helicase HerA-like ATPase